MSQGGFSNPLVGGGGALVYPSIHSPNFNEATQTGWSIDKNGNAFFYGITTSGEFTGTNFVINSAGAFFYSGTPALGNLVLSIANSPGFDAEGNNYLGSGPVQYSNAAGHFYAFGLGLFSSGSTGEGGLTLLHATSAGGPYSFAGSLYFSSAAGAAAQFVVANSGASTPLTSALAEIQGSLAALSAAISGAVAISGSSATGHLLTLVNAVQATGNPNVQWTGAAAGDNMLGIEVTGDSSNRLKVDSTGLVQWGSGAAGQDARLYRWAAGQLAADTILANVAGSAETWHSLGTLAGATVNLGQFRLLCTGMVHVDIDVTFGAATAVPINFSVTIPAAYRPLNAVDGRFDMAQTNAAGAIARIFVGSAGGGSPGQVQLTSLGAANVIGTYSAHFEYPVI